MIGFIEIEPNFLRLTIGVIFICNILVVVNALLSAASLGGELGKGIKKIAAGSIFHVIFFITFLSVEHGNTGLFTEEEIRVYFILANLLGSLLLLAGYYQIYRVSKKLKLF